MVGCSFRHRYREFTFEQKHVEKEKQRKRVVICSDWTVVYNNTRYHNKIGYHTNTILIPL